MDEFSYEDYQTLLEQSNLQEKELIHKRRWLIGLPIPSSSQNEDDQLKGSKFPTEELIPEFLLREDDVSCENIKSFVEKGVGGCNTKSKYLIAQDDMQLVHSPRDVKGILSVIDNMTNQGLLRFADALTGGSDKFEKTRWKMKQTIKEYLSKVCPEEKISRQINLSENLSSILKNPRNYRWSRESRFIPDSDSYRVAVHKILNVLEDLPIQTLSAMHRKLKGNKDSYTPHLTPKRSGWTREKLMKELRKKCLKMLSKLNEGDSLQEPLAKAMEVASLDLKLIQGCRYVTNFIQFSPEVNILQNEIAMSIQLLDQTSELSMFKDIQVLLDPDFRLSDRKLRISINNLLIEYLFECGDMDPVPQSLHEVLAVITKSCAGRCKQLLETKIEEEMECILNVGACMKQVTLDLIPERELDVEFADAYMEDLEDSDGDDFFDDMEVENHMENKVSDEEVGSFGDNFNPVENSEPCSTKSRSLNFSEVTNFQHTHAMRYHLVSLRNTDQVDGNDALKDTTNYLDGCYDRGMCENQYLDVQAACDEASMVAYRLIGSMLNDFAQSEGCELSSSDLSYLGVGSSNLKPKKRRASRKEPAAHNEDGGSINVMTVEELIPSFPECEADRHKKSKGSM